MIFVTLGIIFVFALALSYAVFSSRITKLRGAESRIREALWDRQARVPLLLSLVTPDNDAQRSDFNELLAIREQLSNEHMTLSDRLVHEKKVTELLLKVTAHGESDATEAHIPHFIALKKELDDLTRDINSAISEYVFLSGSVVLMLRLPWFKFWSGFAKIESYGDLQGV